jgi:flagellar protein FlaG
MELEISGVPAEQQAAQTRKTAKKERNPEPVRVVKRPEPKPEPHPLLQQEIQRYLDDFIRVAESYNRKLSYSINRELGEIVVKVIDRETDKVIKEIPPEDIQRLHARIKEMIGILFDEQI